jgi:hypothetical protein
VDDTTESKPYSSARIRSAERQGRTREQSLGRTTRPSLEKSTPPSHSLHNSSTKASFFGNPRKGNGTDSNTRLENERQRRTVNGFLHYLVRPRNGHSLVISLQVTVSSFPFLSHVRASSLITCQSRSAWNEASLRLCGLRQRSLLLLLARASHVGSMRRAPAYSGTLCRAFLSRCRALSRA